MTHGGLESLSFETGDKIKVDCGNEVRSRDIPVDVSATNEISTTYLLEMIYFYLTEGVSSGLLDLFLATFSESNA